MTDRSGAPGHGLSGNLDSARFAIAILHTLHTANLADLRWARNRFYLQTQICFLCLRSCDAG